MRKLWITVVAVALVGTASTWVRPADAAPVAPPSGRPEVRRTSDDLPNPLEDRRRALRQEAWRRCFRARRRSNSATAAPS